MNADVIVVGGGAVGAACARELAASGRRVVVLERGASSDGAAWRAAAGMLAPQIESDPDDPLFDLGIAGRERYTLLAAELRDRTGLDIELWQPGIAHVATEERTAVDLRTRVALQRQHSHHCDWLDADEVRARWPWLAATHGALWAPRDGALDPQRLVAALLRDAERCGAVVVQDEALALERDGDRVTGVRGRERHAAGTVVLAAGAWSAMLDGLPRPLSVQPVRGQMAALPWPSPLEPAIVYNHDCYFLKRGADALLGSTMEYAGFRPDVTPEGLARIVDAAAGLYPAFRSVPLTRSWAGLRPMAPDGLPIVGPEPRCSGLWYATGHGRNGILLAAITAVLVREGLDGEPAREETVAMRPERFWQW